MSVDSSFLDLILQASPLVKAVMALLLAASIVAWTMIFRKWGRVKAARAAADAFEDRFWSGTDLGEVYRQVGQRADQARGMESIFYAGFKEFARLRKRGGLEPASVVEGAQRAMRVSLAREVDELETNLSFLATVGSTSPYIGLFGTVWGIMNSFRGLVGGAHDTLSSVAPGIAEALVATAMGLFAAIPAVIAYNRFANDVERLGNRYDAFMEEFSSILHRHAHE